ncbi:metalloregulator ArsR/SmtB family transcription factor [Sphingobium sp.]|uniref:metalloregulator ArsR/SmtB family transcription factor n=1 Tax=Sphingobium sp. TaxID=1912891 RepID=UPI002C0EBF48|nr:metalloregulator ArsR/SmtB family transcription factor [Sphingobium sp.]HUD95181.1 metalloregulator ArsR/SmtB family transcription factor [Sphingobium sp.]
MDKIFKALASEPRRRILHHLAEEPMTVGEIADNFEMAMPSISRHLAVLKEAAIVREQKRGQYVLYSLASEELTDQLYDFLAPFCDKARGIMAERPRKRRRD